MNTVVIQYPRIVYFEYMFSFRSWFGIYCLSESSVAHAVSSVLGGTVLPHASGSGIGQSGEGRLLPVRGTDIIKPFCCRFQYQHSNQTDSIVTFSKTKFVIKTELEIKVRVNKLSLLLHISWLDYRLLFKQDKLLWNITISPSL